MFVSLKDIYQMPKCKNIGNQDTGIIFFPGLNTEFTVYIDFDYFVLML